MASLLFYSRTLTLTGVSGSVATVASTTGLAAGLKGWLTTSVGGGNTRVYISDVLSATTMRLAIDPESGGSPYGETPMILTSYASGILYLVDQSIYNNS